MIEFNTLKKKTQHNGGVESRKTIFACYEQRYVHGSWSLFVVVLFSAEVYQKKNKYSV